MTAGVIVGITGQVRRSWVSAPPPLGLTAAI